ncbi:MAG: helix-turn-helix transcriptional regulator [Nocardioides sp.]|uniref:helix-turn-helix transcriptional regulator n=1 Tax=Nocardioides sp. TaxID=35761 RepID=UPI003F00351D
MIQRTSFEASGPGSVDTGGLLNSPVRRDIVEFLRDVSAGDEEGLGGLTAAELGERLELHVTTVRFHLDQLVRVGMLSTRLVRGRVGRPRKVYFLPPPERARASADAYEALGAVLAEAWPGPGGVATEVSPREAGLRWVRRHMPMNGEVPPPARTPGEWLGKIGHAFDLLVEWGYQPDLSTEQNGRLARLTLTDCPFLDMAAVRPDVVCGVHQGLVEGVLARAGEPDADVVLRPFVGPRTCTVHITQGRNPRE